MVNIIRMRQIERNQKITRIAQTIEHSLKNGRTIDYDDLVLGTQSDTNLSERFAKEYIKVALFRLGLKKSDLGDSSVARIFKADAEVESQKKVDEALDQEADDLLNNHPAKSEKQKGVK